MFIRIGHAQIDHPRIVAIEAANKELSISAPDARVFVDGLLIPGENGMLDSSIRFRDLSVVQIVATIRAQLEEAFIASRTGLSSFVEPPYSRGEKSPIGSIIDTRA
jgi:hypothetical protein